MLLDDDMEASPRLLEAHLRAHTAGSRLAVIGAAPIVVENSAPAPTAYIARKFNRHLEHLARAGGPLGLRDFYSGNLSIRRDVFESVHGFDERFTIYGNEDLELSLRLTAAGVSLVYEPAAIAHQSYDKDFGALARDNVAKDAPPSSSRGCIPRRAPSSSSAPSSASRCRRRIVVSALLARRALVPPTRARSSSASCACSARCASRARGSRLSRRARLPVLCGARDAEREAPPVGAAR